MFNIFKRKPVNYKNIGAEEFDSLKNLEGHIVIDVRSPNELSEGSIPGYKMINMFDPSFRSKIEKLDKSKTYLVYCRSGSRSKQTCAMMADLGFENLYNLSGGVFAWNSSPVAS